MRPGRSADDQSVVGRPHRPSEASDSARPSTPRWNELSVRVRHPERLPGIAEVHYEGALTAAEKAYRRGAALKALGYLAEATEIARQRPLPHLLAGDILAGMGRHQEADAAYCRALELNPADADTLARHAWVAAQLGVSTRRWHHPTEVPAAPRRGGPTSIRLSPGAAIRLLAPYITLIAAAELAVTYVNPVLVFPLHGGMIVLIALHLAVLEHHSRSHPRTRFVAALLLTLMLSPLIRIISLTLPLTQLPAPLMFVLAGISMMLGALLVARYLGLGTRALGLQWRAPGWQLLAIVGSVGIGLTEYAVLRPEPMGALPWTASGWLPALSLAVATGFPEELIFRGMMQTVARPLIGKSWNVIYVSIVFAALHIGYQNAADVGVVFAASLFYGWVFERSRSIVGISIGHGLANAILFFVAPNIL